MTSSATPGAPRVRKWTDLTRDPAKEKERRRDDVQEFFVEYMSRPGALPDGCTAEAEMIATSLTHDGYRLRVRRSTNGYRYDVRVKRASLSADDLEDELAVEADIFLRRVWAAEAPLRLVPK
jgi:hypothetical protein